MPKTEIPEVSVIMPAYNTAALIPESLQSVFAQIYVNFEVIVVNDGSPDTPELERSIAPYRARIVYIKQENKGAAGARNTAIRNSKGAFLAFLDSDDAWLPEHLDRQIRMFQDQPELDLVYADSLVGNAAAAPWRFMERCPSRGEASFCALIRERCQIPVSTVVVRRDAIVRAGLFDENLHCFDDYDMWVRTAFFGGKIAYTRNIHARLSGKRPGSLSQSAARMAEAYERILNNALRTLPLSEEERDMVKERIEESQATYQLEEARRQFDARHFDNATQLLRQANRYFRRSDVSLAAFALGIAPSVSSKLIEAWSRIRNVIV